MAIALWSYLPSWFTERPARRSVGLGVVLGLGAVGSMLVPIASNASVLTDLRQPLITAASFAGGPISAAIAAGIALIYRVWLGGSSVGPGVCTIILSALCGVIAHRIAAGRPATVAGVTLLALSVAINRPLCALMLSADSRASTFAHMVPVTVLTFCSTCLFILSLQRDERLRALLGQDVFYRAIIEAMPDSLCAKDMQSRFLAANPATAVMMGVPSAADLIGKTDADFYPSDMAARFRTEEVEVLTNKPLIPFDQEIRFSDGRWRWFTTMKIPLVDLRGAIVGLIVHNRDVTDRKQLEANLLRTQNYLQEAIDHMSDGLVLYERSGRIRFCNNRYTTMSPLTADLRVAGGRLQDVARASIERGEVISDLSVEDYVNQRMRVVWRSGESLLEMADGRTMELRTRTLPDGDALVLFIDVTAKKQFERDLLRRASHDPLTGLANRATFEAQLDDIFQCATTDRTSFAVMMLDLDRFKLVNDTHGHATGDQLLVEVAKRMREEMRDGAFVARLGGDEFAFLVVADDIETTTVQLAHRIIKRLRQPLRIDDVDLIPGGSLGLAYFPRHAATPFDLLRSADKALYAVKTRGGGAWGVAALHVDKGAATAEVPLPSKQSVA